MLLKSHPLGAHSKGWHCYEERRRLLQDGHRCSVRSAAFLRNRGTDALKPRRRCYMQWAAALQIKGGGVRCCKRALPVLQGPGADVDAVLGRATGDAWKSYHWRVVVLPSVPGGATIGEWRCYCRRMAVLPSAHGGATVGTRRCYLGRAVVLPWAHGGATVSVWRCYKARVNMPPVVLPPAVLPPLIKTAKGGEGHRPLGRPKGLARSWRSRKRKAEEKRERGMRRRKMPHVERSGRGIGASDPPEDA
jgi:hypothetical protein